MAYFSNSSDGSHFDSQCDACIHGISTEIGCPIARVQIFFNYDQCRKGEENLRQCLTMLVNEDGICNMKTLLDEHYTLKYPGGSKQIEMFQEFNQITALNETMKANALKLCKGVTPTPCADKL